MNKSTISTILICAASLGMFVVTPANSANCFGTQIGISTTGQASDVCATAGVIYFSNNPSISDPCSPRLKGAYVKNTAKPTESVQCQEGLHILCQDKTTCDGTGM